MKRLYYLLVTFAVFCAPGGMARLEAQETPLVFILAGQSNMAGMASTSELPPELRAFPPTVSYFVGGKQVAPLDQPRFGPEVSIAQELARAIPDRDIVLVKHAVAGTSLLAWSPAWDSTRAATTGNAQAGPLYCQLLTDVDSLPLPRDSEFGAIFWMQGERDARYREVAREYLRNLTQLIEAFRRDLHRPNLPFVQGIVNPPTETHPAGEIVRGSQRRAAADIPMVYLVETDDLTKLEDRLHYDTAGILALGRRFAKAYLALQERKQ